MEYLPGEDDVLFVCTPSTCRGNDPQVDVEAYSAARIPTPRGDKKAPLDRHLMPPPSVIPSGPLRKERQPSLVPVIFVSNSVQSGTFGDTYRKSEDAPRSSVRYEVRYRYKRPNYIVTDDPSLWSDSTMHVESCCREDVTSEKQLRDAVPAPATPRSPSPPQGGSHGSVGPEHGLDGTETGDTIEKNGVSVLIGSHDIPVAMDGLPRPGDSFLLKTDLLSDEETLPDSTVFEVAETETLVEIITGRKKSLRKVGKSDSQTLKDSEVHEASSILDVITRKRVKTKNERDTSSKKSKDGRRRSESVGVTRTKARKKRKNIGDELEEGEWSPPVKKRKHSKSRSKSKHDSEALTLQNRRVSTPSDGKNDDSDIRNKKTNGSEKRTKTRKSKKKTAKKDPKTRQADVSATKIETKQIGDSLQRAGKLNTDHRLHSQNECSKRRKSNDSEQQTAVTTEQEVSTSRRSSQSSKARKEETHQKLENCRRFVNEQVLSGRSRENQQKPGRDVHSHDGDIDGCQSSENGQISFGMLRSAGQSLQKAEQRCSSPTESLFACRLSVDHFRRRRDVVLHERVYLRSFENADKRSLGDKVSRNGDDMHRSRSSSSSNLESRVLRNNADRRSHRHSPSRFSRRSPRRSWGRSLSGSRERSLERPDAKPHGRSYRDSPARSMDRKPDSRPKRIPVSFSLKRNGKQNDERSSKQISARPASGIPRGKSDNADLAVLDILDLIEHHLSKSQFENEDEQIFESDGSDAESVTSISKMSVFGAKPQKRHHKKRIKDLSSHSDRDHRSPSPPNNRSKRFLPYRRRSLSPGSTYRHDVPFKTGLQRLRRRSVSPTMSYKPRRASPLPLRRRHRASSFDTIASSQIDCGKLREIAIQNALELRRMGKIPPQYSMSAEERATWRSGGKSLDDLTAFCKRMAQRSRDRESSITTHLPTVNHPFLVKDRPLLTEIIMHINNARAVPVRALQERVTQNLPLRELFPVSSGSTHRDMAWQQVISHDREEKYGEKKSVKKVKKSKGSKEEELMTLEKQLSMAAPPPDYRIPISFSDKLRLLKFQRQLAAYPDNPIILSQMQETQQKMLDWANQFTHKGAPGEFTGESSGVSPVSTNLPWDKQAWARRDQLLNLKPVGGKGQYLLQKMGWCPGQGIGLRLHGSLEPLRMEVKMDRRGLVAEEERRGKLPVFTDGVKTISFAGYENQHPCSALNEYCTKQGWGTPAFGMVEESGNPHQKTFLFQVCINGMDYRPTVTGRSKKLAKAEAAKFCLQALGVELASA